MTILEQVSHETMVFMRGKYETIIVPMQYEDN